MVFIIISFGKWVYFAEGEKDDGMCKSYCDEQKLVDETESYFLYFVERLI